jgi:hypothetical protein
MKIKGLMAFLFFLTPVLSIADGMHVSDFGVHMYEPSQKAVISWNGSRGTILLSSAAKTYELQNMAWIVPVWSDTPPKVTAGDMSIFNELVKYFSKDSSRDTGDVYSSAGRSSGVHVVESKEIGIYDITVLKAGTAADLMDWMSKNGYKFPEMTGISSLDAYISGESFNLQNLPPDSVRKLEDILEENGQHVKNTVKDILDGYISKGNCYFIANKIDLRNKYKKEIKELTKLYTFAEDKFFATAGRLRQELKDTAIKVDIDTDYGGNTINSWSSRQKMRRRWEYGDFGGRVQEALNNPGANSSIKPLRVRDMGNGYTVAEYCVLNINYDSYRNTISNPFAASGQRKLVVRKSGKERLSVLAYINTGSSDKKNRVSFSEWNSDRTASWSFSGVKDIMKYYNCEPADAQVLKDFADDWDYSDDGVNEYKEGIVKLFNDSFAALPANVTKDVQDWEDAKKYLYRMDYNMPLDDRAGLKEDSAARMIGAADILGAFPPVLTQEEIKNNFDGMKTSDFDALKRTIYDLSAGAATPIMIEVENSEPYFPLRISSMNTGRTDIEVYYLSDKNAVDLNGILKTDGTMDINGDLKEDLSKVEGFKATTKVTRLIFRDDITKLTADALFGERK